MPNGAYSRLRMGSRVVRRERFCVECRYFVDGLKWCRFLLEPARGYCAGGTVRVGGTAPEPDPVPDRDGNAPWYAANRGTPQGKS